jgi:hypothetical protein
LVLKAESRLRRDEQTILNRIAMHLKKIKIDAESGFA